jgi:hypothetical protein
VPALDFADERIGEVLTFMLHGHRRSRIYEYGKEQWGVDRYVIDNYMTIARKRIYDMAQERYRDMYHWHVVARYDLFADCRESNDHRGALLVLQDLSRLHGLYDRRTELPDIDLSSIHGIQQSLTALFRGIANGSVDRSTLNTAVILANVALKALAQQERLTDDVAIDAEALAEAIKSAEAKPVAELQRLTDQLLEV